MKVDPVPKAALPRRPEDLDGYVPYLINRLTARWNLDQSRALAEYGLNATMLRTLSVLHIFGTMTVNDIARYAVVEQSTASRAIDAMVEAGLIERRVSADDQRRRAIALTSHGEALLRDRWPLMRVHYDRLVEGIDEADLATCIAVLNRMIANVGEGAERPPVTARS